MKDLLELKKTQKADGSFRVLTPNCLLMGRSLNTVPDDTELASHLRPSDRYQLIHHVTKAPSWGLTEGRTLQRGFINIDSEHDLETVFSYSLDYLSVSCRSFKE